MSFIRIKFIVTGACLQTCFGSHFYLLVPLTMSNGREAAVSDVEAFVRKQWPSQFSAMYQDAQTQPIKMLKSGKLMKRTDLFQQYLNSSQLRDCTVAADALVNGNVAQQEAKAAIIIHLVFQRKQIVEDAKDNKKEQANNKLNQDQKNKKNVISPVRSSPQAMPHGGETHGPAPLPTTPIVFPSNQTGQHRDSAQREGHDVKDESCCSIM